VNSGDSAKRRVSVELSQDLLEWLDGLKPQFGLRNRGAILERVLSEVRNQRLDDEDDQDDEGEEQNPSLDPGIHHAIHPGGRDGTTFQSSPTAASAVPGALSRDRPERTRLDETSAIVLITSELDAPRDSVLVTSGPPETRNRGARGSRVGGGRSAAAGIELPGFVRRQARELGRSLEAPALDLSATALSLISGRQLEEALARVDQHWLQVYGQPPQESVLEAAMVWLARDVWPRSDHSDGRPFTWNLTQQVVASFSCGWSQGDPSLERVIVAAGVLEDPFSGATLELRVPTLITRFVQWHRSRQKRATSFDAIDQTMTVHSALKLLQLPTVADRPYSLQEIREAYREQAQRHHPDAGGSADAMRRLNEAYQFLKDRYRRPA
jgi:hypothetical protein